MALAILRRRSRSINTPPPLGALGSYLALGFWAFVVLFPLYWLAVTSLKLPIDVNSGPFYLPYLDFRPTLENWRYIFVDLRDDPFRPYLNTVVIATTSTVLALVIGSMAAYGLARLQYRPTLGAIGVFVGCAALAAVAIGVGVRWVLAVVAALALFALLLQTIGKRFRRALGNNDIAFWMISQRMLPPITVVIPIYVLFQQLGLLDTWAALIITYVAANLPIVVWLMRDYFQSVPLELEESAAIDGASRYRIFRTIVLPLSVPGLVATFLFVLVFAWNEYLFALFLTTAKAQTLPMTVAAANALRPLIVGKTLEAMAADMGHFWREITGDSQLRWIGPDKGAMHLATAAVVNAVWDLWAKAEKKPVWKLLVEMSPAEVVRCIDFRYITDAITPDEALAILKELEPSKRKREDEMRRDGFPAYTTSAGWLGYSDDRIRAPS